MTAGEFKPGSIFKMDDVFWTVVSSTRVQQPRMVAFVRAMLKNLETGQSVEKRFNTGDHFPDVALTRVSMQFLYNEGSVYHFMNPETFDQIPVDEVKVSDAMKYNTEGVLFTFVYADEKLLSVTPPTFVVMEVVEAPPATAGDTARSALKNAKLETGIEVKVPMFVNTGDKIKVDTRTGEYAERA
ncbi:MAG: elongation factor P [Firmicutes bacterium]|nr:elongation factor P [Bacillota bacterium]